MTDDQRVVARRFLAYRTLTSMWFMVAVWLYFYRLFITDQQVGVLDAMAFAIGLLAEVPSGALADKFGRDRVVRLGQILAGSGLLIQAAGSDFVPIFVGQSILMVGVSFASGADEALFFSKLHFKRSSAEWRKLITRASQCALVGSVFATILGGWLHTINPRIPWVLTGLSFIAASLLILKIKDDRPRSLRQSPGQEIKDYLQNIKTGFAQFRLPKLWLYVPIILTVQGLFYTAGWGLLRLVLLDRYHFEPFWGSVVLGVSSLITVGLLAYMHKHAEQMSEKRVLTAIAVSAAAGLLLSLANIGAWGFVVILSMKAGEYILYPFMSEILNNDAPEDQRATVLSVASFLRTLPYVALAPLIGYLNTHGQLEYFLVGWAALIGLATLLYLSVKRRDSQVKIDQELA